MKIEKEIKKIIEDYAWTNEEGKSVLIEKEDFDNIIFNLAKLFKTYARSLVPGQMKVDCVPFFPKTSHHDGVERPALEFRYFCTLGGKKEIEIENDVEDFILKFRFLQVFEDGWNKCREEMLNMIDNGEDGSLIVKDGWRMNKEGKIEIQTGLGKHDDKWSAGKYRGFEGGK